MFAPGGFIGVAAPGDVAGKVALARGLSIVSSKGEERVEYDVVAGCRECKRKALCNTWLVNANTCTMDKNMHTTSSRP